VSSSEAGVNNFLTERTKSTGKTIIFLTGKNSGQKKEDGGYSDLKKGRPWHLDIWRIRNLLAVYKNISPEILLLPGYTCFFLLHSFM